MIGRTRLDLITDALEHIHGPVRCRGELVLAIQRALYGSEAATLSADERAEVLRYLKAHLGATSNIKAELARL